MTRDSPQRKYPEEMLPVIVLAGGYGSRLDSITLNQIPKPMVKVKGVPFLELVLLNLHQNGVQSVIVCVGYLGKMIEEYLYMSPVCNKFEQLEMQHDDSSAAKPAGTAQAIRHATRNLDSPFIAVNGDTYLDIDFNQVLQSYAFHDMPLLVSYENHNRYWPSNLIVKPDMKVIYRKKGLLQGTHVDAGIYVLRREVFSEAPRETDLSTILELLSATGQLRTHVSLNRFYEINTPESLKETREYFSVTD